MRKYRWAKPRIIFFLIHFAARTALFAFHSIPVIIPPPPPPLLRTHARSCKGSPVRILQLFRCFHCSHVLKHCVFNRTRLNAKPIKQLEIRLVFSGETKFHIFCLFIFWRFKQSSVEFPKECLRDSIPYFEFYGARFVNVISRLNFINHLPIENLNI